MQSQKGYPKALTKNLIWVATNYSHNEADLTLAEIQSLTNIFFTFVTMFNQDVEDEDNLVDVINGLALLAKIER